jgi:pyruvate/2-oxoglutarate dehydrogenase complex dihydrolipoamide dehydrogenase (E3) component
VTATGSRPWFFAPAETNLLNSDQLLEVTEIPGHLLVIGGGYIGCEFASNFRALGSIVTLVEKESRILPDWDADASAHLLQSLREAGVNVVLGEEVNVDRIPRNPGTHSYRTWTIIGVAIVRGFYYLKLGFPLDPGKNKSIRRAFTLVASAAETQKRC